MTTIVGPRHIELPDREPSKCIDQKWLAIPPDSIEYRALNGDTGETNGGHWCGAEAGDWGCDLHLLRVPAFKFGVPNSPFWQSRSQVTP